MNENEKFYDAECIDCGDRNYRELKSYISSLTRYTFADRRNYIDLQNIQWKIEQIEKNLPTCRCECQLCAKCDEKDGDE